IDLPPKVKDRPLPGPTVFTDASSSTSTAAAVWQEHNQWQCVKMKDKSLSVQLLEASAVLCQAMSNPGVSTSPAAVMIEEALYSHQGTVSVMHINSHDPVKGFFQIGNDKADAAAKGLWTLQEARQLHESLHVGAKALVKQCSISMSDAKHIVATCPHCQK
ncbi:POL1 protein, partial [Cercotrichas coryphoeus]|nr:POL1 protein [Cercotrichas coryphoeus]